MAKYQDLHLASLVVVAVLFGGGGVGYSLANLVVQLLALGLLAANFAAVRSFAEGSPRLLAGLVAVSLLIPLFQLVPLPPQIWTGLPGRAMVNEALASTGGVGWYPLSVNSARTLVSLIGLFAPAAMILLGYSASERATKFAVTALFASAALSLVFGFSQVLRNSPGTELYNETPLPGILVGFFANRNSTAVFLVCCLTLLCGQPASRMLSPAWLAKLIGGVLMVTGVVLTQSRTGVVLLAIPILLGLCRLAASMLSRNGTAAGQWSGRRRAIFGGTAVAALLVFVVTVGTTMMSGNSRLADLASRFDKSEDARSEIWEDAKFSAQRYWPVGAGMGTFDEVFQLDESLENLSVRRAGRAHNDYLEIAIEGGFAAIALLLGWLFWIAAATWRAVPTQRRWQALSATGMLTAVALQSLFDYPLRNQTMLVTTALAVVLLARAARTDAAKAEQQP